MREDNAQFLIKENTKSLAEISLILGYSDQTAFTRAYKSWFGHPPSLSS
ncbi:MAG: helix-turn-helix domain-containing protein [Pseudomonadota bacterium]